MGAMGCRGTRRAATRLAWRPIRRARRRPWFRSMPPARSRGEGIVAVHTWIAIKPTGAGRYTRYEVLGFGVANGAPAVRIDRMGPDNYWFGARPQVITDRRGPGVD